jgi:hypothetical protein
VVKVPLKGTTKPGITYVDELDSSIWCHRWRRLQVFGKRRLMQRRIEYEERGLDLPRDGDKMWERVLV